MTFRMEPAWCSTSQVMMIVGRFTIVAPVTTVNTQIVPANINNLTPGVSNLLPTSTVSPGANKVPVFANPNGTVAANAANVSLLPRGLVATTTGTLGSEFVLDLTGFPGEVVAADAAAVPNVRTARTLEAVVNAIDNSNGLVYINTINFSTGALQAATAGFSVAFKVFVKDNSGI